MKKPALALLLMSIPLLLAAKPDPSQYPLTMTVQCSYWRPGADNVEMLGVLLNGKSVELLTLEAKFGEVLPLGDYKARLTPGRGPESSTTYELILPNGKTRSFYLSGFGANVCGDAPQ